MGTTRFLAFAIPVTPEAKVDRAIGELVAQIGGLAALTSEVATE
jgi:hypothetical protein